MDLAISTADERGDGQAEASATEPGQRPHQARFQRPGENLPKAPAIDPALVFKGGIALVFIILLLAAFWIIKSLAGSGPAPSPARSSAPATSEISEAPAAAATTVSIVALEPVRIKVVRKSDGVELFQGAAPVGRAPRIRQRPDLPDRVGPLGRGDRVQGPPLSDRPLGPRPDPVRLLVALIPAGRRVAKSRAAALIGRMEKIPYLGQTLTRWRVGGSTFVAHPEMGARLMYWNIVTGDGSVRDVILWPELKTLEGFPRPAEETRSSSPSAPARSTGAR
jgi:hypothetical protein